MLSGRSSMAELQPSKLATRVRFPSPAPGGKLSQGGVMAAAADSKSAIREYVRVRVPLLAPDAANDRRQALRRGVRVVESAALERRCRRKSTGGSNPPLSANIGARLSERKFWGFFFCLKIRVCGEKLKYPLWLNQQYGIRLAVKTSGDDWPQGRSHQPSGTPRW